MSQGRSKSEAAAIEMLGHPEPEQLWFQIAEIFDARTYLQHGISVAEGDVVFDVGANVGVAAVFFAAICGAGSVYCFEPVPPIFEVLLANTAPYPACVPTMCAIGRTKGSAAVTYYPHADAMSSLHADPVRDAALVDQVMANKGVSEALREQVLPNKYQGVDVMCSVKTLSEAMCDAAVKEIDLLKVDVERGELDVLHGIDPSDWSRIRQIVAEVHGDDRGHEMFADLLNAHGFDSTWVEPELMKGTGVAVVYAVRP